MRFTTQLACRKYRAWRKDKPPPSPSRNPSNADLLLIDERDGFRVATGIGLRVTGTLGLLDLAAERGLVDFGKAIKKLEQTSFRRPKAILDDLLRKHAREDGDT